MLIWKVNKEFFSLGLYLISLDIFVLWVRMCLCSEAWLFTQPTTPEAGPEWKACCFTGVTATFRASAQILDRCDGQVEPGKEYFGRLKEQRILLNILCLGSDTRCYGGVSMKVSLSLSILGSCETLAASLREYSLWAFYTLLEWHLKGHNIQKDRLLETIVHDLVLIFIVLVTFIHPYGKETLSCGLLCI